MARVKRAVNAVKKRRKILKLAKGYFGLKSTNYRIARQAVMKSLNYSYVGRKLKKRDFRRLWIARINAAARMNGISYSRMMGRLEKGRRRDQPQDARRARRQGYGRVRGACQRRQTEGRRVIFEKQASCNRSVAGGFFYSISHGGYGNAKLTKQAK